MCKLRGKPQAGTLSKLFWLRPPSVSE